MYLYTCDNCHNDFEFDEACIITSDSRYICSPFSYGLIKLCEHCTHCYDDETDTVELD